MVAAPPQAPEVGPPRPLSLAPLNFASGCNYALFQRSTVDPPHLTRPLGWPQFGYLAEAPRGNFALSHGPRPAQWPPGGPGLVIWLRATMPVFRSTLPKRHYMLVATLYCAAYAIVNSKIRTLLFELKSS